MWRARRDRPSTWSGAKLKLVPIRAAAPARQSTTPLITSAPTRSPMSRPEPRTTQTEVMRREEGRVGDAGVEDRQVPEEEVGGEGETGEDDGAIEAEGGRRRIAVPLRLPGRPAPRGPAAPARRARRRWRRARPRRDARRSAKCPWRGRRERAQRTRRRDEVPACRGVRCVFRQDFSHCSSIFSLRRVGGLFLMAWSQGGHYHSAPRWPRAGDRDALSEDTADMAISSKENGMTRTRRARPVPSSRRLPSGA